MTPQPALPRAPIDRFLLLMALVALYFIAMMLTSCSTEKRFLNAAKRYGESESCGLLLQKYPHLFPFDSVPVPLVLTDTVYQNGDTLVYYYDLVDSTGAAENNHLKLTVERLKEKLKVTAYKKADTLYVFKRDTIKIPVKITPAPDCPPCKAKTPTFAWVILVLMAASLFILVLRSLAWRHG